MKRLNVQIQPELSPSLDLKQAVARLVALGHGATVSEGDDDGPFTNVGFQTGNVGQLWTEVEKVLDAVPGLRAATIVACEGERGWIDYRILHHFDPLHPPDDVE